MTRRIHGTSSTQVGQRQTGATRYWLSLCSSVAILLVLLAAPGWAKIDLFQSPVNNFIEPSGGDRMAMTS